MKLLLDGFVSATSTDFQGHCQMLVTILHSNMLSTTFLISRSANFSLSAEEKTAKLKSEAFELLKDLEVTFACLNALTKWDGIGHDGKQYRALLKQENLNSMAAKRNIPHDEWMATIQCHNCNKMGHFAWDCQDKKRSDSDKKRSPTRFLQRQNRTTPSPDQKNMNFPVGKSSGCRQQRKKVKEIYNTILDDIGNSSEKESEHTAYTPRVHNSKFDEVNTVNNESDSSSEDEFSVNAARVMWSAANSTKG
jgi:hypothetical protein